MKLFSPNREIFKARTGATDADIDKTLSRYMVLSILDIKSKILVAPPFLLQNADVAIREFGHIINGAENKYSKNPHDYVLMHLCDMDYLTGQVYSTGAPVNLCSGTDVLDPSPRPQLTRADVEAMIQGAMRSVPDMRQIPFSEVANGRPQ